MERGMRRNAHVPCGAGEKLENLKLKFKYKGLPIAIAGYADCS